MFHEKQHCCCCVPLPEGVMLLGIYGTSFHVGLLSIQLAYKQATLIPSPVTDFQNVASHVSSSASEFDTYENPFNPIAYGQYTSSAHSLTQTTSSDIIDKEVVEVVYPLLVITHALGIAVNLLLGKAITTLINLSYTTLKGYYHLLNLI